MNSFKQDKDNQNGSKDQMAGVGNQGSKIQWISNSAMMAANQQTPWRIYFKDTIILWVGLGILTVLILTGSLTDLGFPDRRSNLESNRNTQILKDNQSLIHVKHRETRDEQLCSCGFFILVITEVNFKNIYRKQTVLDFERENY